MAQFLQKILGGQQPAAVSSAASVDDDFADFAGAPDPSPVSIVDDAVSAAATPLPSGVTSPFLSSSTLPRPYTKWYRVWERVYLQDFYAEAFIIPFILIVVGLHIWGSRKNKRKAKSFIGSMGPVLQKEFASVGFTGRKTDFSESYFTAGSEFTVPTEAIQEKTSSSYITYATGRQNIAFLDIKLSMNKRYNPIQQFSESALSFFFESFPAPRERMEATSFVFDGQEAKLVPAQLKAPEKQEKFNSSYDGFVWAIVHKEVMKELRDGRYDLSLTTTRDNPKLPEWATVMSESAEITETLLTTELQNAVKSAGEALEALIISDQPIDQPKTLNESIPKKRISLALRLPSGATTADYAPLVPLFTYFIRLADILAEKGRFRPDAMRRVKATREDEIKKIKRADENERNEERRTKAEAEKKRERDEKLRNMSSEQQRKFLEKERAQEMRKSQKGRTMKA